MNHNNEYAVFILTNNRPHKQITLKMLRRQGYTGAIYLVIDSLDESAPEYFNLYGKDVVKQFDKPHYMSINDSGTNSYTPNTVLYARDAVYDIADELGYTYFIVLDDDYNSITYKFDADFHYVNDHRLYNLDALFSSLLEYYKAIPAKTLAIAQGGDYIGGVKSGNSKLWLKRKAMNLFVLSTKRRISWLGILNDDVNTYALWGLRGQLFLTLFQVCLHQQQTQKTEGGLTSLYKEVGTYVKSFYTVIYCPSGAHVQAMGVSNMRWHHRLNYNALMPKILSESYKVNSIKEGG